MLTAKIKVIPQIPHQILPTLPPTLTLWEYAPPPQLFLQKVECYSLHPVNTWQILNPALAAPSREIMLRWKNLKKKKKG